MADASPKGTGSHIELSSPAPHATDPLDYTVVNAGDVPILLGAAFAVERRRDAGWERIEDARMFRAWGRRLAPSGRCTLTARLPADSAPGAIGSTSG